MRTRRLTGVTLVLLMLTVAGGCGSGSGSRGGAVTFSKSYGGSGFDEARAVAPTTDGGYVFAGTAGGVSTGFLGDLWLSKLDANGNLEWQSAIGPLGLSAGAEFSAVRQTADGGFVAAGVAGFANRGTDADRGADVWVAKFSAAGLIEWQREIDSGPVAGFAFASPTFGRGAFADDRATDVWPAPDGGYVVAGESEANLVAAGGGNVHIDAKSALVMRLDAQGNVMWQRRLPDGQLVASNPDQSLLAIVRAAADNGAVLAYSRDFGHGIRMRVIRFESDGDLQWQYEDDDFAATDLVQTRDDPDGDGDGVANDGFIVSAASIGVEHRLDDFISDASVLVKLDRDGQVEWRRRFGRASGVTLVTVDQVCIPRSGGFDCDFVAGGTLDEGLFDEPVAYILRLNTTGDTTVERRIAPPALRIDDVWGAGSGTALVAILAENRPGYSATFRGSDRGRRLVLDESLNTLAESEQFQLTYFQGFVFGDAFEALNGFSAADPLVFRVLPRLTSPTEILTHDFGTQRWFRYTSPDPLSASIGQPQEVRREDLRSGTDVAVALAEVAPGSYVVAGESTGLDDNGIFQSLGFGWVLRITNGRVEWQRHFSRDTGFEELRAGTVQAMVASGDGGVVLAGEFGDVFQLIKLAADGSVQWESARLDGPHTGDFLELTELRAVPSGGFVVVGTAEGTGGTSVFRLDAGGSLMWERVYDVIGARSLDLIDGDGDGARDDGFIIAGGTDITERVEIGSQDERVLDVRLAQLNIAGEVLWARSYRVNGAGLRGTVKARQTSDGGYVIGLTDIAALAPDALSHPFGQSNVLLIRLDAQRNVIWSRSYGAFLDERLHDLQVLADGGLLVAGGSKSLGELSEAWLLRLGPDGLLADGCNAFLGSLPPSAFRVEDLTVSVATGGAPLPVSFPLEVVDTSLVPRVSEVVQARQCFGSAPPPASAPAPQRFTLTVSQPGTETGVVTSTPAGLTCGTAASPPPCNAAFDSGDVFLTVDPGSVSRFLRWEDCSEVLPPDSGGAARCRVRMDRDRTVRAIFGAPQDRFLLRMSVIGTGTVTSSDDGIQCGTFFGANQDCEQLYDRLVAGTNQPTSITLSVFTNASDFAGWGGDCASFGTTNAFNLVMDSDKSCTATFVGAPTSFELALSKSGNGTGVVTSAPAGISCGAACNASFDVGQTVRLLAFEDAGSAFDGWSGCDRIVPPPAGSIPECEVDMNANRNVGAAFTRSEIGDVLLEFVVTGSDGIVETADRGITCTSAGPDCQELYAPGTSVQLSFNLLRAGGAFLGWGGDCPFGLLPTPTLVMTSNRRCTAMFSSPPTSRLTVGRVGPPSALVRSTPVGIDCGVTCSADFTNGQTVRLTLELAAGSRFSGWTGCDRRPAGTNPWPDCEVDMNADRAVEVRAE